MSRWPDGWVRTAVRPTCARCKRSVVEAVVRDVADERHYGFYCHGVYEIFYPTPEHPRPPQPFATALLGDV